MRTGALLLLLKIFAISRSVSLSAQSSFGHGVSDRQMEFLVFMVPLGC